MVLSGACAKKDTVVAEFGEFTITLAEFRYAYVAHIKQPNVFDAKETREKFLEEMIRRRLLAHEAKKLDLSGDERLQYRIAAYRNKYLREVHYREKIEPKIHYREEDLEEAYLFSQEKRRIRHLFAETKEQADALMDWLESGVPFESLAGRVFQDSLLANNGGDLGWVEWSQLDYELATAAFRLPLNTVSSPIKSQFGYHIIEVTDYEKKPLITQAEYLAHRDKLRYMLENKIGEQIAANYIQEMMATKPIHVYPQILEFVGNKLSETLTRRPSQYDQLFESQLSENELRKIEVDLWDIRDELFAEVGDAQITVGDFLGGLIYVPYDVIYQSYKRTMDFIFRDFALTREALANGYDTHQEVALNSKLFEENLYQLSLRRKLVNEVVVTEEEVEEYYAERKDDVYADIPFGEVREIIRGTLLRNKKASAVPDYVEVLLHNMSVKKNTDVLHSFYDAFIN